MRILRFLFLVPLCASAQDDVARVEVKAASALQQRRDDTAGRVTVGRDELLRYGDPTLADILRRQPGVTVNGGQVQLRGLGGGRTLFLLNGEPAPPGFSPDSLAPELIERIEIMRSASADSSGQGIAGSINIILRKSAAKARTLATLDGAQGTAGWWPEAALDLSRPGEVLSGSLAAQWSRVRLAGDSMIDERNSSSERRTAETSSATSERLDLSPRLNWKLDGGATLAWQGLLDLGRNHNRGSALETALRGDVSDYPVNAYAAAARTTSARSDFSAALRLSEDARLEWKAGMAHNRRDGDYRFTGSDAGGQPRWLRRVLSSAADDGVSSSGKLRFGGTDGHALAAGWDGTLARRAEWRRQEDADPAGLPLDELDQRYTARVRRLALYAQDEWSPLASLDAYLGLRWEGLRTLTNGRDLASVSSSSAVWSPVAHVLWRLPGARGQLRLALAHTYKAPDTRDLVPRRFTVNNGNGPTNPDVQGNPALRPELAWGLDAAYEAYRGKDSMFSVAAYQRRIADVIGPVLFQDRGKWVATPSNIGNAGTYGLELDGRLALGAAWSGRLSLSRNWSHVDSVPGPANRLGEQVPLTVNVGLEYRLGAAGTAGFNWHLQRGGVARVSASQWNARGSERRLDLHASWQLRHGVSVRVSASNVLRPLTRSSQLFIDGTHDTLREAVNSGMHTLKLAAEFSL